MQKYTFKTLARSVTIGVLVSSSAILAGCTMHQPSYEPTSLRNKITVAETVERMELYVQPNGLNLSMHDQDAMNDFLGGYVRSGQGQLYINIPENTANGVGVQQARNVIAQKMAGMGISNAGLQMGQYQARSGTPAPVIVSYRRLAAVPINCHQGAALTQTGTNQPYPGFGCAQNANLAAMVSNPRQFLSPANSGYSPAARGVLVVGKYMNNEVTGTPRPAGQEVSSGSN